MSQFVAITAGDVAGIGPEVIVRAICDPDANQVCIPVLIGHPEIFQRAARLTGHHLTTEELSEISQEAKLFQATVSSLRTAGRVACWNPAGDETLNAPLGEVSALAGEAAFQYLISAIRLARSGCVDAIVTAPLNKEALHLAGHHYPGHTEILAEFCGVNEFAMMLHLPESALADWRSLIPPLESTTTEKARHGLSIAHVTLHTSIASVPDLLTEQAVAEKIRLMADFLSQIQCQRRAIAVCALNPHGGEHGLFGDEEQSIIAPAIKRCRAMIPNLTGPLPVDTLIRRAISGEFDGVVAMYHDQGHIPVKLIGFNTAVNITLGLPIVRTSPSHGTAFDRAWNPSTASDAQGMKEAIQMAVVLAKSAVKSMPR